MGHEVSRLLLGGGLHYRHCEEHLLALLAMLKEAGYSFTTVTPATHRRVTARPENREAQDLRGVFGWNLPFRPELLPSPLLDVVREAAIVSHSADGLMKTDLRVASVGETLFLHSGFPTDAADAVFLGPDTYRFVRMLAEEIPRLGAVSHLVDIGAGSGAGGIIAAQLLPGARITLADVNPAALQLAAMNASHAGVDVELVEGPGLAGVLGQVDLAIANPPYIMDPEDRTYRSGGDMHGARLSLDWTLEAARRLQRGGHMLLYTGVAIISGHDALLEALQRELPQLDCDLHYREIDPDIFGEELEREPYGNVERIAAVGAVIRKN